MNNPYKDTATFTGAEVNILLRHGAIHREDELKSFRCAIERLLEASLLAMENARTAYSRPTPKKEVVDYLINDAIETVTKTIETVTTKNVYRNGGYKP